MNDHKALVLKFGGAALQDVAHFHRVSEIILQRKKFFKRIIVVVSAMGKTTDDLINLSKQVHGNPPKREQDMLLSVGERISMALLAMLLSQKGEEAISFTGSQAGIITSSDHSDAKIINIRPWRLIPHLEEGKIVIVAGFQGVSEKGEITTLGRGGSDTTAVALAVALRAERVEFYKDVKGIFENDPKLDPNATHIAKLNYKEAIEVVGRGERKILHPRSLLLAEKNNLTLKILSFNEESEGSLIVKESGHNLFSPVYEEFDSLSL